MNSRVTTACLCLLALFSVVRGEWAYSHRADSQEAHTLGFALKTNEGSFERGHALAEELHDPEHASYQNWLSLAEIEKLFINKTSVQTVHRHLQKSGYKVNIKGDFLWATAPISVIESHLASEFHHYAHPRVSWTALKTERHVLPAEIAEHVHLVINLDYLPSVRPARRAAQPTKRAGKGYTDVNTLQSLYGVPGDLLSSTNTKQLIIGQGVLNSDLTSFFQQYNSSLKTKGNSIPIQRIGKDDTQFCSDPKHDCGEPTLDMQYSMAMAPGITTILTNQPGDGLGIMYNYLASTQNPPQVSSASLGTGPSKDYDIRICQEVQKAALRGVTSFVASGDGGAFNNDQCGVEDTYPSNCPYITSVGGTQGPESGQKEVTWDHSGIGVANGIFAVPDWQKSFLAAYLSKQKVPGALNPNAGRVYPDVAGVAAILPLVAHGKVGYAGGTSFASPIWAGIATNLVSRRNGKGFGAIHISIAKKAAAGDWILNDIKSGSATNQRCGNINAADGWDIGTGFGTPNFGNIQQKL